MENAKLLCIGCKRIVVIKDYPYKTKSAYFLCDECLKNPSIKVKQKYADLIQVRKSALLEEKNRHRHRKKVPKEPRIVECDICGTKFTPTQNNQKRCSAKCKQEGYLRTKTKNYVRRLNATKENINS